MKIGIMLMLWLLIFSQYPLRSDAMCEPGDIRYIGIIDQNNLAGRLELCDNEGDWRAVCAGRWGRQDASVACRQMGFSDQDVESSTDSRYGTSSLNRRFYRFDCVGDEENLLRCNKTADESNCLNDAGVECRHKEPRTVTETINDCMPPSDVTVPLPTGNTSGGGGVNQTAKEVNNCAALSGGLGALVALVAVGMLGVVLGWVWSYHKMKRKKNNIQERTDDHANPTYSTISASQPRPLVRYSSTGPQDNPTHGTLVSPTYDIIKNEPHPTEGECDYQVPEEMEGGMYEVPIQTGTSIDDDQKAYS